MTRLDLVRTFANVLHRRQLYPCHGLALILCAGQTTGLTRREFRSSSGLSSTRSRRALDDLVTIGYFTRTNHPRAGAPIAIYHLTPAGEYIAAELLAKEPTPTAP